MRRGWRSTLGAAVLALAGAIVTFLILHRTDVGSAISQVTLALLVFAAFFVASLVAIAARIERERDEAKHTLSILAVRIAITSTMRAIAADVETTLALPDASPELDQGNLEYYARRALDAVRSDRFAHLDRTRELDVFLSDPEPETARQRLEQLGLLLRQNVYDGTYLRP